MTKVWVASHIDIGCDDTYLLGIFSTEKKAQDALDKHGWVKSKAYAVILDEAYPEE